MRSKSNLVLATSVLVVLGLCGSTLIADVNEGLISHWRLDEGSGTIAYDSAGTNDGTIYGATWTTGQVVGALDFDGSNDYVSIPHDPALNITGDITIAAWVNFTRVSEYEGIVTKCVGGGGQNVPFEFRTRPNIAPLTFLRADTGGHERVYSDYIVTLGQWHHVLVRVENKVPDFYVDGIITGKGADVVFTRTPTGNTNPVLIGRRDDGLYFDGLIDDVRIYDRALSAAEIMELYAPSDSGPIAHWKFDEGSGSIAYDSAGTNNGTIYGANWTAGQLNNALSFDGVNDYVDMGDTVKNYLETNYTVSAWVQTNTISNPHSIVMYRRSTLDIGYQILLELDHNYSDVRFIVGSLGNNAVASYPDALTADTWYHVAGVREGNILKVYVDGVSGIPDSETFGTISPDNLKIGANDCCGHGAHALFDGTIDDVRIYDRALSAEEIMELYAPSDSGPIAHWKFDEGSGTIAYDSAGTHDGTVNGATWTTGQVGGALDFDGVDDYVDCGTSFASVTASTTKSIMAWVNSADGMASNVMTLYRKSDSSSGFKITAGSAPVVWRGFYMTGANTWNTLISGVSVAENEWTHLTLVQDGANINFYINSTSAVSANNGAAPDMSNPINASIGAYIYGGPSNCFNGKIDDVRIYDRALSAEEIRDIYVSYPTELRDIDIKPGSCPNPLNVKSRGLLPVSVLGSEDFDVYTVDIASTRLAGVAPIRSSFEDVGTPLVDANECECSTEGPDGFLDLTLKFETQTIVEAIGEVDHDDELVMELTGVLSDETPIEGSDCVIIRGKHKPINKADFNGDGIVDMADFAAFAENWLQSSIVEY